MDYARKFYKKKSSTPMTTKSSISLDLNYPKASSEPIIEEKKLTNWKKWLKDRKKHCEVYKKTLRRNENELILNSGERFRSIMETRDLMEKAADPLIAARIQKKVDLGFWIMPEVLPNRGNPNLPDVEVPSKRKSIIPKMEHVSTPKKILEEKGLSVPKGKSRSRNEYLKKRTEELADIISVIEPNPPEMENLFVQGRNFRKCVQNRKSTVQKVPVIALTTAEETEKETSEWSINPDTMIAALWIENKEIIRTLNPKFKPQNEKNGPYNWNIGFQSRGSELVERKIHMENKGNLKITFYWRPVQFSSNLIPIKKTSSFFFNKNTGMILPGQIIQFPIWFKLSQPGVRTENWKLETDPRLSSEDLLFRFWGHCTGEDQMENSKAKKINQYLDNRIRDTAIRRILEELIEDVLVFQPPDPPYKNLFLESEIFSLKNPSYFYHPHIVKEFREIYESISTSDGLEWNLSLFDLRQILLEIEDPEFRQLVLARFVELCRVSLEPSLYNSSRIQKHERVFDLLCAFANQFEVEDEFIKNIYFGSCEGETESLIVESGDQPKSNSLSRTSSGALSPRKRIKSKKKNRKSISSTNSKEEEQRTQKLKILKPSDVILFKEIFYLRIYELLGETISKVFATIDSYIRLNEREK